MHTVFIIKGGYNHCSLQTTLFEHLGIFLQERKTLQITRTFWVPTKLCSNPILDSETNLSVSLPLYTVYTVYRQLLKQAQRVSKTIKTWTEVMNPHNCLCLNNNDYKNAKYSLGRIIREASEPMESVTSRYHAWMCCLP